MIEYTESAFYYGNSDEIKFYEHREFTKLYHKWIGTGQDEGNSQEETETFFDKQKSKAQQRKQTVTFAWWLSHTKFYICNV